MMTALLIVIGTLMNTAIKFKILTKTLMNAKIKLKDLIM